MSNPTTNYIIYNQLTSSYQDLSGIFMPLSLGTSIGYDTSFNVAGYGDLSTIFASVNGYSPIGYNTGLQVNGNDLSTIFADYNSKLLTETMTIIASESSNYTVSTQTYEGVQYTILLVTGNNSTASMTLNTLNSITVGFILIGGGAGGGGGVQNTGGGGGGGAGGFAFGSFTAVGNYFNFGASSCGTSSGGENNNPNNSTGTPGGSSSIGAYANIFNGGTVASVSGGNSESADSNYNGGQYGNTQNGGTPGLNNTVLEPNGLIGITTSIYINGNIIGTVGNGGSGGVGCDASGNGAGSANLSPLGYSPVSSGTALPSDYSLSYLGNTLYVGGGGSGAANNQYQSGNASPPGAQQGGGYGGYNGNGGDALTSINGIPVYGAGGGGGSGGSITGAGGSGGPGCAILWWPTYV